MKFSKTYVRIFSSSAILAAIIIGCFYIHPYIKQSCSLTTYHLEEKPAKSLLGNCTKCKKSLRTVHGRFGDFVGCSGYPQCNYIKRKQASFVCPQCAGNIEERKYKHGTLWGCSNYPDCRYAIFSDIQDTPCPACTKTLYMLKTIDDNTIHLTCPDESCKHTISQQKTTL